MRFLAVITARAGSKRLPGKNLKPFADTPLIQHSITSAQQVDQIDRTIVSTDGEDIAQAARDAGADVPWLRPAELATDEASSLDVARHALDACEKEEGRNYDALLLLQPTSPLRSYEDIRGAIALFKEHQPPSVLSVCEIDHPLEWTVELDAESRMRPLDIPAAKSPRYRYNGAIYIYRRDFLLEATSSLAPESRAFVMPRERSVDIDTELDFQIAETIYKSRSER